VASNPACYFHGVPIDATPDNRLHDDTLYVVPDYVPDNPGLNRLCCWLRTHCSDVITVSEMEAIRGK
jgi:hypothetical protein